MVRKIILAFVIAAGAANAQTLPGPPKPASINGNAQVDTTMRPSIYAAATVNEFLTICGNDQGGCADEVGMALNDKMVMDGTANICLPGPDYAVAAISWLKAHPETKTMPTEDGIYLALRKTYPCG